MKILNCIIIEDQPPAQRIMKNYISRIPYLNLLGTFTNALQSLNTIANEKLDLIFLDLNLPEIDGFSFLSSLSNPPSVIVTTAHTEYAIRGFELNVMDYLLKPFSFERFLQAVSKFKITDDVNNETSNDEFIFIKINGVHKKIDLTQVSSIMAEENYVHIYIKEEEYMVLGSLQSWDEKLVNRGFCQVHKSHLVNITLIDEIVGNYILVNNRKIPIGRKYKKFLIKFRLPTI